MKMFAFKNRLFVAFASMTVALVLLFAVLLISMTASLNRKTELSYQQEVFAGNAKQVETMLDQANRLAMQVATNNEILSEFIALQDPDGARDNYFEDQLLDAIRLGSILSGINGVDGYADRISVFNRYGDYVSTGRLYETKSSIARTLSDTARIERLIEQTRTAKNGLLVAGFGADEWSDNPNAQFLTVYRTLSYNEASTPYGLVAVQLKADRVRELAFYQGETAGEYYLLDDQARDHPSLVYPDDSSIDARSLYSQIAPDMDTGRERANLSVSGDARTIVLASRLAGGNWLFVRALAESSLAQPYWGSYLIMILGCALLLVLLLAVDNFMAERISRPLTTLSASVGSVNFQNMRLKAPARRNYSTKELAALDDAFRAMLSRLDKSIQLEMQAYMRMLQSQMNPHFLYNMLSVIIASSEQANDARTVSMCLKLTAMLRYVADFKRDRVSLKAELEHTRNYLELMKERYEDLFAFEIETDEAAEQVLLPKLTVQPLAENCFMHGFQNEPPWHIRISARAANGRWRLLVEDNGLGMTEEEIADIFARLDVFKRDVAGNYSELSLGGMGLINTLLRLTFTQRENIEYAITRRDGGGLRVEIGGVIV